MEQRLITLELIVQQNTKMTERLDWSMTQLCQAVADLRVQMIQGQAELRQEIASSQAELRKEMASSQAELRKEMASSQAELRKEMSEGQAQLRQEIAHSHTQLHAFFERKFMWLISAYCGGLLTLIGFMAKYFLDSYAK